jgi:uncharacterized membrane protein YoaK (UPF0700 family)
MATHKLEDKFRDPDTRATDAWLSFGLAFIGGYGDAAGFVLAKTFTGHVTGNLVLGAIALAAHDWRASLGHLSAIVTFLAGVVLSVLIAQRLKAWRLPPIIVGIEVILIVAASLVLAAEIAHGVEIFVIFVSLALGLQNGSFHRVGGISVHTTYLTGMITNLISTEAEKCTSEVVPPSVRASDLEMGILSRIWVAFVLAAGAGAGMVFRFKALGMLGATLILTALVLREKQSGGSHIERDDAAETSLPWTCATAVRTLGLLARSHLDHFRDWVGRFPAFAFCG